MSSTRPRWFVCNNSRTASNSDAAGPIVAKELRITPVASIILAPSIGQLKH
ncbi:hypothetical protein [Bradyrhizobium sp.]|uniref:hypothetical protein n=1 Tax=Bradyrhizobium sp. TaxID=376 RepID=UPI002D32AF99|nr:hypothetical protein [Bradyrhizobium sp.]HZR72484.1 hypothetical protein [Bradyrhizobium sp.]